MIIKTLTLLLCLILGAISSYAQQRSIDSLIDRDLPSLLTTYKTLHAAPELSHYEKNTAGFFASQLRSLGFTVTENVGKYQDPRWTSYGVVAVLKNGPGPTVLLRTDLDGLPVEERTGLPYASTVKTKNDLGQEVGVMHACGHDIHITSMLGTAKLLTETKNQWSGTVMIIGQPAEEIVEGARAMLSEGLYDRFPKPNFILALHDNAENAAGRVVVTPGYALASSTTVDLKIRGRGGHGARPETTKDPIVIASQVVLALQTLISRENSPLDPAVITVGSIHGGSKHNIIPDEVNLQLTIRTYKEDVRKRILASIERVAKNIALAAGVSENLAPIMEVGAAWVSSTYNDPELTERLVRVLSKELGENNVEKVPPAMVSEDFGYFSLNQQIPSVMFWLGAADPARVKANRETGAPLPSLHSPLFAPVPEPTLRTGIKAMTSMVLDLLKK